MSPKRRGEHELTLRSSLQAFSQEIRDELGDGKCPSAPPKSSSITLTLEGSNDPYTAPDQVKIRSLQTGDLTPTRAEIGACIDEGLIAASMAARPSTWSGDRKRSSGLASRGSTIE